MSRRAHAKVLAPLFDSEGIEPIPLEGITSFYGPHPTPPDHSWLTEAAVEEALQHPLGTDRVHLVAARAHYLQTADDARMLLDRLDRASTELRRLRTLELGRWLTDFGRTLPQIGLGATLREATGCGRDWTWVADFDASAAEWYDWVRPALRPPDALARG